ncbi:hypothetical protein [Mesomycoplasma lagogenitalium]|uniref:DUF3923 family protein n=1 Tax=Mesomycoplasma lagogenitalium TaxID=171286 RepID=A0ABY8LTZ9_9BACT|nr:hypothetical protein [Mesomycoplasma lagogenitalium]WGI36711.1 hypothetical protein QEG99_00275 [Mesomycoplasma lagogenitalium]
MSFIKQINFSNIRKEKWFYIVLWILFSILLVTVVMLLTLYKVDGANLDAVNLRANIIAGFVLVFVLVFFAAIISTVVVHGFLLKKGKGSKK